jgi:hypothetical protein
VTAGEATPRPWRIGREGETIWIEGPRRSAASERFPADRRIVCEFRLYGDEELDAETKSNFELIVEAVNAR